VEKQRVSEESEIRRKKIGEMEEGEDGERGDEWKKRMEERGRGSK
jgi:hypothetical protein